MKPKIVLLLGRAGAGKTSAGQYLVSKYGAKVTRFADPVKKLAQELWGFTTEQVYGGYEIKEKVDPRVGISPREALQRLGEGARKYINKCVWSEPGYNQARQLILDGCNLVAIDDARYVNECTTRYNDIDIHVVKIVCTDSTSTANMAHPSEAEVDQVPADYIDHVIISSRKEGLQDLYNKLDVFMNTILK